MSMVIATHQKRVERLLEVILSELHLIRISTVPTPPMSVKELAVNLTKIMGDGPDEIFNK